MISYDEQRNYRVIEGRERAKEQEWERTTNKNKTIKKKKIIYVCI